INTANAVVGRAPVVDMDSSRKAQRVAEARFLRALYYFVLVQMYGPVTLTLQETDVVSTQTTRAPVDSIYDAIIDDLHYAEATLDYVSPDYGRVTKGAAQHLLAKVYLTRLRSNDASTDETLKQQAGDFANAADYAQRVINSGHYQLLSRFADVFDCNNERNAEVIWSVQFTTDPLTTGPGNSGHLYFLMEYDVMPGMKRDIANGRPFKRFRPTWFLLGLYDRTRDSRYDAQFTRVWYANNTATIPKDAQGVPTFQLGDTAVYVSPTDADALVRPGPHPHPGVAAEGLQPRRRAERSALPRAAAHPCDPAAAHDLLLHSEPGILRMSDGRVPRRTFLAAGAAGLVGAALGTPQPAPPLQPPPPPQPPPASVRLGVASYSLRKFSRDKAIEMVKALGTPYVNFKSVHLPYELSATELAEARREIEAAGLQIVGGGVISFDQDSDPDVEKYFAYARAAGMPLITPHP